MRERTSEERDGDLLQLGLREEMDDLVRGSGSASNAPRERETRLTRFVAAGMVMAAPTPCRARRTIRPFLIKRGGRQSVQTMEAMEMSNARCSDESQTEREGSDPEQAEGKDVLRRPDCTRARGSARHAAARRNQALTVR